MDSYDYFKLMVMLIVNQINDQVGNFESEKINILTFLKS